jgi:Polyketide cyclase / dehydrase and lipid transport
MTIQPHWHCEHSTDVDVPTAFAFRYMTDIRNWNDPPAEFDLDGPFAAGARGTTRMPGQPAASWTIRDVEPDRGYTIEGGSFFERAHVLVHWQFEPISDGRTRLRQRMELFGENAAAYVDVMKTAFEPNLAPGMRRIAGLMARAHSEQRLSSGSSPA